MGLLDFFSGKSSVEGTLDAFGNTADKIFTSDEERLEARNVLAKIATQPDILQGELNLRTAGDRRLFIAGWRPFIGWVCGICILFLFLVGPLLGMSDNKLPTEEIIGLTTALLGLGGLRSWEKWKGLTK